MDRMAEPTPLCFQQMIGSGAKFALRGVYGLANAVCRIDLGLMQKRKRCSRSSHPRRDAGPASFSPPLAKGRLLSPWRGVHIDEFAVNLKFTDSSERGGHNREAGPGGIR